MMRREYIISYQMDRKCKDDVAWGERDSARERVPYFVMQA